MRTHAHDLGAHGHVRPEIISLSGNKPRLPRVSPLNGAFAGRGDEMTDERDGGLTAGKP